MKNHGSLLSRCSARDLASSNRPCLTAQTSSHVPLGLPMVSRQRSFRPLVALLLAVFAWGIAAPEAQAGRDVRRLNIGVAGGYQLTSPDMDLLGDRSKLVSLSNAPWFALRAGFMIFPSYLGLELNVAVVPQGSDAGISGIALPTTLDIIVYPISGIAEPYISVGAGVNALVGGELGTDADFLFGGALGVRLRPINELGVRLEVRVAASDAVTEALAANVIFALGVDWLGLPVDDAGLPDPTKPIKTTIGEGKCAPEDATCQDTDGDGISNADDACPDAKGIATLRGCPDTDSDGVADFEDDCPIHPGTASAKGCPDRDGDGLHDGEDACPEDKGEKEQQGCPDPDAMRLEDLGEPLAVKFKSKSSKLTQSSQDELGRVAKLLRLHKDVRIEVRVWTSKGKARKQQALSASRAHAIVQALIERGIPAKRVRAAGQGKAKRGGARVILYRLANVKVLGG